MHQVPIQLSFCRFPATFTFVLRAFSTLEGIGRALDPDYKFVAVAQPYATQLLNLEVMPSDTSRPQTTDLE
jgi:predicted unusual protein kinase regulating ubiquinone biosynthesis (AarF/ABC1/UbiB family)